MGNHGIYHFHPVAEEKIILACSKQYYSKSIKREIRNQISLTQLQDKVPTLTEKVFIKFLLKEIDLIGL